MIHAFLLTSGLLFWAVVAVVAAIEVALLSNDGDETPVPILLALVALTLVLMFTDALEGVRILWLLPLAAVYAAIGVAWSVKKWWTLVVDARASTVESWRQTRDPKGTFEEYAMKRRPSASENKQRIVTWMALWPFSMSWWVLTWPRRFFSWLYERISTTFDRITDKIWSGT